jgi:hypothetical protein
MGLCLCCHTRWFWEVMLCRQGGANCATAGNPRHVSLCDLAACTAVQSGGRSHSMFRVLWCIALWNAVCVCVCLASCGAPMQCAPAPGTLGVTWGPARRHPTCSCTCRPPRGPAVLLLWWCMAGRGCRCVRPAAAYWKDSSRRLPGGLPCCDALQQVVCGKPGMQAPAWCATPSTCVGSTGCVCMVSSPHGYRTPYGPPAGLSAVPWVYACVCLWQYDACNHWKGIQFGVCQFSCTCAHHHSAAWLCLVGRGAPAMAVNLPWGCAAAQRGGALEQHAGPAQARHAWCAPVTCRQHAVRRLALAQLRNPPAACTATAACVPVGARCVACVACRCTSPAS